MLKKKYTYEKIKLHPDIQKVCRKYSESSASKKFQQLPVRYNNWTWCIILFLRICGFSHYDALAILWYDSYLIDDVHIRDIFWNKKRKKLLDVWSGSGSITELFQPYVGKIVCLESSYFFRRKLKKKGFSLYKKNDKNFDTIALFNVLDRCSNAQEMIEENMARLEKNGIIIISLPFPVKAAHGHGIQNSRQKSFSQSKNMSFEKSVSQFYEKYLKNSGTLLYFSRMPYIVLNPESTSMTSYDNALFVCKKK